MVSTVYVHCVIVAKEERRKYRENCHYFTEKVFKVVCGYALKDAIYSQGI